MALLAAGDVDQNVYYTNPKASTLLVNGLSKMVNVTAAQLRAARGLLGWSQTELAQAAGLSLGTVKRMEGTVGPGRSMGDNITAVLRALDAAGIEFVSENGGGEGVRFKRRKEEREEVGSA